MAGTLCKNIITVRQGDSFNLALRFLINGKGIDLNGSIITMDITDQNGNLIQKLNGEFDDILNGFAHINISPLVTSNPVGDYKTDIQIVFNDGSVQTFFPSNVNQIGIFRITEQVTR